MSMYQEFSRHKILCRLYESPFDQTINPGPPCVYIHAERSHVHIKDPVVHVRVQCQWIMEMLK